MDNYNQASLEENCASQVSDQFHDVSSEDIFSPTRGRPEVAFARQCAIWLYYTKMGRTNYTRVGRAFGRDRTTARHAIEVVDNVRATDPLRRKWLDFTLEGIIGE